MSDFLGRPPTRPRAEPDLARTLEMLATLFLVALVVTTLYVGREIFIPIAIAIPVSFVLSPPILLLRRWGLGRVPSVLTVIIAALVITFLVTSYISADLAKWLDGCSWCSKNRSFPCPNAWSCRARASITDKSLERKALSLRESLHVLQQLAARAGHAPEDGLWVGRKLTLRGGDRGDRFGLGGSHDLSRGARCRSRGG